MRKIELQFLPNLPTAQWDMVVITPELLFANESNCFPSRHVEGHAYFDNAAIAKSTF